MSEKEEQEVKEFRVGNFKVKAYLLNEVNVIEVMNLEGTWMVRVPEDFQMYGILNRMLLQTDDDDTKERARANEWLHMFFMNWQNTTGIPSGHYHQAIMMLTACYAQPELLKSSFWGKGKDFHKSVKKLRQDFIKWANEREKLNSSANEAIDMSREALADQSRQILNGQEEE